MKDKKTRSKRRVRTGHKNNNKKRTVHKKKRNKTYRRNTSNHKSQRKTIRKVKQIGGAVDKIRTTPITRMKSDTIIMLTKPSIEFLPTSQTFKGKNMAGYLSMIELRELLNIINREPNYKKSPIIQKVFNYKSAKLVDTDEITFNYTDIKCDRLIIGKPKENSYLTDLFLLLLECNTAERFNRTIQSGGDEEGDERREREREREERYERALEKDEQVREEYEYELNSKYGVEDTNENNAYIKQKLRKYDDILEEKRNRRERDRERERKEFEREEVRRERRQKEQKREKDKEQKEREEREEQKREKDKQQKEREEQKREKDKEQKEREEQKREKDKEQKEREEQKEKEQREGLERQKQEKEQERQKQEKEQRDNQERQRQDKEQMERQRQDKEQMDRQRQEQRQEQGQGQRQGQIQEQAQRDGIEIDGMGRERDGRERDGIERADFKVAVPEEPFNREKELLDRKDIGKGDSADEIDDKMDDTDDKIDELEDEEDELEDDIERIKDERQRVHKKAREKVDAFINKKEKEASETREKDRLRKELFEKVQFEKKKAAEIKINGYEQYLEDNKVINVSNNEISLYNVNWFKVCCGIDSYDELFELEILERIQDKGITIEPDEIISKIVSIVDDEGQRKTFQQMIKTRILSCSDIKESNIFQKIFTDSIGSFKNCDKRDEGSILYLYDEYRVFLNRKLNVDISKLDRILILIYVETRQELLSKYIGLEMLRRKKMDTDIKSKVISLLDDIMKYDKAFIDENDKKLDKIKEDKYKDYRDNAVDKVKSKSEFELLSKERKLKEITNNKKGLEVSLEVLEDNLVDQEELDKDIDLMKMSMKKRKEMYNNEMAGLGKTQHNTIDKNIKDSITDFIRKTFTPSDNIDQVNLELNPNEEKAYNNAVKSGKIQHGGDDKNYTVAPDRIKELCDEVKKTKQFKMSHLNVIDNCK
jgi:hypothetical protein